MSLEQGDVILVDFNPSVGHEPAKLRPAVVVSGYGFNSRANLVAVVPDDHERQRLSTPRACYVLGSFHRLRMRRAAENDRRLPTRIRVSGRRRRRNVALHPRFHQRHVGVALASALGAAVSS